jgi:hypothetical protein
MTRAYAKRIDRLDPERYSTVNEPGRRPEIAACVGLLTREECQCQTICAHKNALKVPIRLRGTGGADRVRTDDLRLAKPALSQLSYSPQSR